MNMITTPWRLFSIGFLLIILPFVIVGCGTADSDAGKADVSSMDHGDDEQTDSENDEPTSTNGETTDNGDALPGDEPVALLEGDDLKNWKTSVFGTDGDITMKDGELTLGMGFDLTGITWTGDELPTMNYEIALEAKRVQGGDFFCGLTFPFADSHASLIVGGWAGSVVGISSLDDMDAANNETTKVIIFQENRWYTIRVRNTTDRIQAWLDDEKIVDVETAGRKVGIRGEVQPNIPLGLSTFQTTGAIRNMTIQKVDGPVE